MFIFRIPEQSKYFNGRASNFIISWHCHEYCFVFYRPIRTSGQNWNCLDKIEGQILSRQIFVFQSGQILSTVLIMFLCRARQNIENFGGITDHVQILVLVAFFCASKSRPDRRRNAAYGVLVFPASVSSNQGVLLMVEHCRRSKTTGIVCNWI